MKVSRETSDMRVQRAIEADARMREIAKRSVDWPDPSVKKTGFMLKPIHVGPDGQRIVEQVAHPSREDVT